MQAMGPIDHELSERVAKRVWLAFSSIAQRFG
jgi:hypothetical protein